MDDSAAPVLRRDLTTERLVLRPFESTRADEVLRLFRDPSVRRFLLDDQLVDEGWVATEIEESDRRFAETGAGLWSLHHGRDAPMIGFAGFRPFFDPPRLQLLYGLLPTAWGKGFATEAAEAVCAHGFEALGFTTIEAAIDVPNVRSGRVLERVGFTPVRTTSEGDGTTFYSKTGPAEGV